MTDSAPRPDGPPPPAAQLMLMVLEKFVSRSLTVVADLGIADILKDGSRTAEELAMATETHADGLYRVLRALTAVGVFNELPGRRFENNDLSQPLREDAEGSVRAMASWINDPVGWQMWEKLDYSVKTGKAAAHEVFGTDDLFGYLRDHPSSFRNFQRAMTSYSAMTAAAVAGTYDFSGIKKLVDVGGGHGALLSAIIARHPNIQGVLYERPEVIEGAGPVLKQLGQANKIETAVGDFFENVPEGADAYIMKHIIHDWDDDKSIKILGNCREVMAPGARVLVVEQVISDAAEAIMGKMFDLEMLVIGGRERTEEDFAAVFSKCGLKLSRVVRTESPVAVVEAVTA